MKENLAQRLRCAHSFLIVRIANSDLYLSRETRFGVESPRNIDSATSGSIKEKALGADRPDAAPAFSAMASGHSGDVNSPAA